MLNETEEISDRTSCKSEDESSTSDYLFEITSASNKDDFLSNPDGELETYSDYLNKKSVIMKQEIENYVSNKILGSEVSKLQSLAQETRALKEKLINKKYDHNLTQYELSLLVKMEMKLNKEIEEAKETLQEIISEIPQLKLDADEKVKNLKDSYNAYMFASKKYQKYLNLCYDIETVNPLLFHVCFFTTSPKNHDYTVSIKKEEHYTLIKTSPVIPKQEFERLSKKLLEDGDLRYLLCVVSKLFSDMNNKENKESNN